MRVYTEYKPSKIYTHNKELIGPIPAYVHSVQGSQTSCPTLSPLVGKSYAPEREKEDEISYRSMLTIQQQVFV